MAGELPSLTAESGLMSWTRTLCACAALALAASGCANLLTSRAIDAFSEGYAAGDVEGLRKVTSERFERQALRLPEAGDGPANFADVRGTTSDLRNLPQAVFLA